MSLGGRGVLIQGDIAEPYRGYIFNFTRKFHTDYPSWLHQFTPPPTVNKASSFPPFLSASVNMYFLETAILKGSAMESQSSSNLHVSDS